MITTLCKFTTKICANRTQCQILCKPSAMKTCFQWLRRSQNHQNIFENCWYAAKFKTTTCSCQQFPYRNTFGYHHGSVTDPHDPDDKPHRAIQSLRVGQQRVGLARQPVHDEGCHPWFVEVLEVDLAVLYPGSSEVYLSWYDPVEKSSTSMMADSKLLLNFDAQSCKASLQMPEYWSSASEIYLIS